MILRLGISSLLLTLLLAPTVALADISDADRATARALAMDGQEALDRQDYATALDRFGRADALIHAPTLLLGVARAEVGMGRWIAAEEAYTRIVREGAPAGSPEPFLAAVEDARKELDALSPRIPRVVITVDGGSAAEVTIDGQPVPTAALGVKRPVDPGAHAIKASAPGFAPAEAKVTLNEGSSETVALTLRPAAPASAQRPSGALVAPPDTAKPSFNRTAIEIAALGVGGAGVALGAITGLLAIGKHSDLQKACPGGVCSASQQGDLNAYHTLGTLSTVGFIAGGIGLGAGAFLILTAPKPTARAGGVVTPVIGLGYAGAQGRF